MATRSETANQSARKRRITVDLSGADYAVLQRLQAATGISYANLSRFGLSILHDVLTTLAAGGRVTFTRGDVTSDVLLPFHVEAGVLEPHGAR